MFIPWKRTGSQATLETNVPWNRAGSQAAGQTQMESRPKKLLFHVAGSARTRSYWQDPLSNSRNSECVVGRASQRVSKSRQEPRPTRRGHTIRWLKGSHIQFPRRKRWRPQLAKCSTYSVRERPESPPHTPKPYVSRHEPRPTHQQCTSWHPVTKSPSLTQSRRIAWRSRPLCCQHRSSHP
jgi:hypothetical protein